MDKTLKAMVAAQVLSSQVKVGFTMKDPDLVKDAVDVAEAIDAELVRREKAADDAATAARKAALDAKVAAEAAAKAEIEAKAKAVAGGKPPPAP